MKQFALMAVLGLAAVSGCATKTYGRLGPLTSYETASLTCREIDLDIGRTHGFIQRVNNESEFSGKDVLAFLGDFGIGNSMEKSAAMESATTRLNQLESLRGSRCSATSQAAAEPGAVPPPAAVTVRTYADPPPPPRGQDAYNADKLAQQQACHASPRAVLAGKGPGFEAYTVACSNGDTLFIRCEFGNCRPLR